ncbi:MAG TPA: hypothetical protein VJL33_04590 [Candidatus Bathyarchaeia archaeon]|nr:hypothetical protein [Candidatus Bathyarchaeia archaeon]
MEPAPETDLYGEAITALIVLTLIALLAIGSMLVRRKNRKTRSHAAQNHKALEFIFLLSLNLR